MATQAPAAAEAASRAPRRSLEHDYDIYEVADDGSFKHQATVKAKSQVLAAEQATGDGTILVVKSVEARLFKPVRKFVAT